MKPEVRAQFLAFTDRFEGYLDFMYLDVLGLVTTGRGNLIDPIGAALALPWRVRATSNEALPEQVITEWQHVKGLQARRSLGGGAFRNETSLFLAPSDIDTLCLKKLDNNEAIFRPRYPKYDAWPWQAQLGVHSMAWAMGPAFRFPRFDLAANADQWRIAAIECHMNDKGNPGLVPRNAANKQLFLDAARVVDGFTA